MVVSERFGRASTDLKGVYKQCRGGLINIKMVKQIDQVHYPQTFETFLE